MALGPRRRALPNVVPCGMSLMRWFTIRFPSARSMLVGCAAACWWCLAATWPVPLSAESDADVLRLPGGVSLELVRIPAGEFRMGSPESEPGRSADETLHSVRIGRAYYIGRHEVTQREYTAVIDTNPSFYQDDPQLPVESVTWDAAHQFCRRVSELTGRTVQLPTEAQWEHACRAGTTSPYSFGSQITPEQVNFDTSEGGAIPDETLERTTPVGDYPPNGRGLFDMHGNVREWCADWYGPYPAAGPVTVDPLGPPTGEAHVLRGGSWDDYARRCRSAYRYGYRPGDREQCNGFRVVVLIDDEAKENVPPLQKPPAR